jgi:hypothetical protein
MVPPEGGSYRFSGTLKAEATGFLEACKAEARGFLEA